MINKLTTAPRHFKMYKKGKIWLFSATLICLMGLSGGVVYADSGSGTTTPSTAVTSTASETSGTPATSDWDSNDRPSGHQYRNRDSG
ncbi:KxYKxGKxW signal peptide domain-containing protein [Secundilactobacillus collinoides]|uniref:KxYKxGKxW signal peptide domain-containing protein n=1 Tax=Secundilactobacillus collinoides TaxID=33960 RepID=UPI0006D0D19F|nr:KxYKxGKxW signal peptide domain-containing protein [Secundilactobacillus collinoides]